MVHSTCCACCGHVHLNRSCSEVAATLGCIEITSEERSQLHIAESRPTKCSFYRVAVHSVCSPGYIYVVLFTIDHRVRKVTLYYQIHVPVPGRWPGDGKSSAFYMTGVGDTSFAIYAL